MSPWRVAWITGASQGIGRALALGLARQGVAVAASARSEAKLAALCAEARDLPGAIHSYPLDVTDAAAGEDLLQRLSAERGLPDLVILNAGTHQPTPAQSFRSEDLRRILELNVIGVANGLQSVLPPMLARGGGQVAVVASLAGYRGLPTAAAYGASKAALINLCEALRLDLHGSGVKLQLINPGFVRTPLTDRNPFPMPFLVDAEVAAARIIRGLRGSGFEIRFPTPFALIMGLLRHLPYSLYLPLVRRLTQTDKTR